MPSLNLITNVKVDDPKAFSLKFAKFSAATLEKPEAYISTSYTYNETLTFNGNFEPAVILNIYSLDNLNELTNKKYSKEFFEFFGEHLGVPGNRGYIAFIDPGRANMGHNGTTFETIFGNK